VFASNFTGGVLMRVKWVMLSVLVLVAAAIATYAAQSSVTSPFMLDPNALDLEVVKAKTQAEIRNFLGKSVSAKPGYRLAVVTLRGSAKKDCRVPFNIAGFAAVYEENGQPNVITACAASPAQDFWGLAPESVVLSCTKAAPVEIQVAFSIPDDVTAFSVQCPSLAQGEAVLQ
jgi:hypothetical protein